MLRSSAARSRSGARAPRATPVARALLALLALCSAAHAAADPTSEVPRTVIALYDARRSAVFSTNEHRFAEMPLNHLGLVLEYHDINRPLPDIAARPDVRGVLVWERAPALNDPRAYLRWVDEVLDAGKRFVSLGDLVVARDRYGQYADRDVLDSVLERIGVVLGPSGEPIGADARIVHADPQMVGFERALKPPLPYFVMTRATPAAISHLTVLPQPDAAAAADLVVVGAQGGYVAAEYALHRGAQAAQRQWQIDPFAFFRAAFATDDLPKPDTTTIAGRRIYYSHVDGDGWRNVSLADAYAGQGALASRVVLEQALRPYPDLPVTVAPISADLDRAWYGTDETRRIAREIFALPQVEVGTHTHTHPFAWRFFEHYEPAHEERFLSRYRKMHGGNYFGWSAVKEPDVIDEADESVWYTASFVPRAYALEPFDLEVEISGSARIIAALAPPGKHARIVQWSGDTLPFEAALGAAEAAGLANINGGDSRFDAEFPSYAFVAPVGRREGRYWQIYASNSNENTYTDLWRGRYFGFAFLPQTLERTEAPRRVRAANLYYHIYSGERQAALRALLDNLAWVRSSELAPIATSRYAAIAAGFFHARLATAGRQRWTVHERGALNTLRFDDAAGLAVDWPRSQGVIGQRHHQGSLYVALDESAAAATVAVTAAPATAPPPLHLVHARWRVYDCTLGSERVRARAAGYGRGDMVWRGQPGVRYAITREQGAHARRFERLADADGRLAFDLGDAPQAPVRFSIERVAE